MRVVLMIPILIASMGCFTPPPLAAPELQTSLWERCTSLHEDPEIGCIAGPYGIVGVRTGFSYFYVVPAGSGVVLIDAGANRRAGEVQAMVGDHQVLAVLLTHAHADHWAGAHTLQTPVYLHRADAPRMTGRESNQALVPWLSDAFGRKPPLPARVIPVVDGFRVTLGDETFTAISTPGHTPGSVSWMVRDVLFTGDALMRTKSGELGVARGLVSDDVRLAKRSAQRLLRLPFSVVLDGHFGRTDDARARLRDSVARWQNPHLE